MTNISIAIPLIKPKAKKERLSADQVFRIEKLLVYIKL